MRLSLWPKHYRHQKIQETVLPGGRRSTYVYEDGGHDNRKDLQYLSNKGNCAERIEYHVREAVVKIYPCFTLRNHPGDLNWL